MLRRWEGVVSGGLREPPGWRDRASAALLARDVYHSEFVSQGFLFGVALSNTPATARASPSTGAYRDSAAFVKRLPTRGFQLVDQQDGSEDLHRRCFWNNHNPMLLFDQWRFMFVWICQVCEHPLLSR